MIDMAKLKPILEPLLTEENTADIIDQISAIDEEVPTQAEIDALNKQWSDRYKKAFFNGEGSKHKEPEKKDPEPEKKTRFDQLFK